MTKPLEKAFAQAVKLPKNEQDRLAKWLLAELQSQRRWDAAFARSTDWYDEQNTVILKNIRASMSPQGKILIIGTVIPEGNEPHFGKIMDLEMLLSPGGVERTESEFRELLAASGLRLNRVVPTKSIVSIVEAVKAD
ncbi:MAG TPA: methyltransferase [Acidobacteriota bacterium]|jgi:hypothetical protein